MTEPWKQPHEDIRGVRHDNDLISIDESAIAHRTALIRMARHLQTVCMVGQPAPVVARMWERISNPRPGDLVVESTAIYGERPERRDQRVKGLGYLLERRREWWHTDDEWAQLIAEDPHAYGEDDPRPTDDVWYVQYAPNPEAVCRWTNCSFIMLPVDITDFSMLAGRPDERGGATYTRDSLLGSLSDSGFELRMPQ